MQGVAGEILSVHWIKGDSLLISSNFPRWILRLVFCLNLLISLLFKDHISLEKYNSTPFPLYKEMKTILQWIGPPTEEEGTNSVISSLPATTQNPSQLSNILSSNILDSTTPSSTTMSSFQHFSQHSLSASSEPGGLGNQYVSGLAPWTQVPPSSSSQAAIQPIHGPQPQYLGFSDSLFYDLEHDQTSNTFQQSTVDRQLEDKPQCSIIPLSYLSRHPTLSSSPASGVRRTDSATGLSVQSFQSDSRKRRASDAFQQSTGNRQPEGEPGSTIPLSYPSSPASGVRRTDSATCLSVRSLQSDIHSGSSVKRRRADTADISYELERMLNRLIKTIKPQAPAPPAPTPPAPVSILMDEMDEMAIKKTTDALSKSTLPDAQKALLYEYYCNSPKKARLLPDGQNFLDEVFKLMIASLNNSDKL